MMPSTISDVETALLKVVSAQQLLNLKFFQEKGKANALVVVTKPVSRIIWVRINRKVRDLGGKWKKRERLWIVPLSSETDCLEPITKDLSWLYGTRGNDVNTTQINIEEFKAFVRNLIPANLKQAKWICNEVERLTQKYPELKKKIEEWGAEQMPESEKRELEEIIHRILAAEKEGYIK